MNAVSYVRTGGHSDADIRDWSEVFTHKISKYQRFQDGAMATEINIESVSENYGVLIAFFRNGVWSNWQSVGGEASQPEPTISLADELLKFKGQVVRPKHRPRANAVCIQNDSSVITAENGYSVVFQCLNTKFNASQISPFGHLRWQGVDPRNHWASITGDNGIQTGTTKNASLQPIKDDLRTGIRFDVISDTPMGQRGRTVREIAVGGNVYAEIRGLGRPYIFKWKKNPNNHGRNFPHSIKIPIRLALVHSKKERGREGTILRDIKLMKVLWVGSVVVNLANNSLSIAKGLTTTT